jgi:gamma-glutamylcyclotransferase (GGCT)/AIG2-like uncharacterized protein YtfP
MPLYFAYGSNCSEEVMQRKQVRYTCRRRATLHDFRLLFNKRAEREFLPDAIGFANVNEHPGASVEGILYEIIVADLDALDASERYPDHYDRIEVIVETDIGPVDSWVYQAQPSMTAHGLVPSRNYLNHILAGREFLSDQYYEALDSSRTYAGDCGMCRRNGEVLFVREADQMHTLCQPCREARTLWSDVHGRQITISEAETVMRELVVNGSGFGAIQDLIQKAVSLGLLT